MRQFLTYIFVAYSLSACSDYVTAAPVDPVDVSEGDYQ